MVILKDLAGMKVSLGWMAGLRSRAAALLETSFIPAVRALLGAGPAGHRVCDPRR
jgi:hypothetical protein